MPQSFCQIRKRELKCIFSGLGDYFSGLGEMNSVKVGNSGIFASKLKNSSR